MEPIGSGGWGDGGGDFHEVVGGVRSAPRLNAAFMIHL